MTTAITDRKYDYLYAHPPATQKGRAKRAAFLIQNGRACTRAYDDCFEMYDGEQVLALLMEEIRARPELRAMMQEQGAWCDDYDRVPDPNNRQLSFF